MRPWLESHKSTHILPLFETTNCRLITSEYEDELRSVVGDFRLVQYRGVVARCTLRVLHSGVHGFKATYSDTSCMVR